MIKPIQIPWAFDHAKETVLLICDPSSLQGKRKKHNFNFAIYLVLRLLQFMEVILNLENMWK